MQKMLQKVSIFAILGALWRRWFGGGFGKAGLITRFWKYLVLALIVLAMYYVKKILDWYNWHMYAVMVSFAIHWAIGHGDYYRVYDTSPDEGRIKWIDWCLRTIYGEGNYYNVKGNVTGLFLRYSSTAILVACSISNPWFILAGIGTAFAYLITGKISTMAGEYLAGALNFALLYLCL